MARQRRGVHPNFYPTRSYESITKWCAEINLVERVPELMRRAFAKLRSGRPGPVLLVVLGRNNPSLYTVNGRPLYVHLNGLAIVLLK